MASERTTEPARAFEILESSVLSACVRIHDRRSGYAQAGTGETWGSGFFVAPGWVLTCAHVIGEGERAVGGSARGGEGVAGVGSEVGISFTDDNGAAGVTTGLVEWLLPAEPAERRGAWQAPDLALVRVRDAVSHACLWLSDRPRPRFQEVAYFGCTDEFGEQEITGRRTTLLGDAARGAFVRLGAADEIEPGMSGGPVVDLRRGEVVGVVKARRNAAGGGLAVTVTQLRAAPCYQEVVRAHDRYHLDRHLDTQNRASWADHQQACLPPGRHGLAPGDRAALLGMLAELPPPDGADVAKQLVDRSRGEEFGSGLCPAPLAWRDGFGMLYDPPGGDETATMLRYVSAVAALDHVRPPAPDLEERLWDKVLDLAGRHSRTLKSDVAGRYAELQQRRAESRPALMNGSPHGAPADRPEPAGTGAATDVEASAPTVLVEAWQDIWTGSYSWQISVLRAGGRAEPRHDGSAATEQELWDAMRDPLLQTFRSVDAGGDRRVRLEVAVPPELFVLPVDAWELSEGIPVGVQRQVVFRYPSSLPVAHRALQRSTARWNRLREGPLEGRPADCAGGRPRTVDHDWLDRLAEHTVPVHCRSADAQPTLGTLHAVRETGYPVAVCRRPDAAPAAGGCADFHRGAQRELERASGAAQLPARLQELRGKVFSKEPDAYWSLGVGLVFDDPGHPLPVGAPLNGDL
ncbi:VMAP-C domain-containing protein [Streptomyces justiciae]|uniref:VMAP-C domain-containing protein n=1 Tax=Streptomyces justiciae TaxID=2780140 RepID=UPI002117376E|nr:trypsin-like peptidase domain-containing protein [Streptomyces justiciae]MCW8381511.1 serine protease [Streptomyces justiciae]